MDANAMFEVSFQHAVMVMLLLYGVCIGALALLGVSAAAFGRRRLLRLRVGLFPFPLAR